MSPEPEGRTRIALNLQRAAPETVAAIAIDCFDGLDSCEDLPGDGRFVADCRFWCRAGPGHVGAEGRRAR